MSLTAAYVAITSPPAFPTYNATCRPQPSTGPAPRLPTITTSPHMPPKPSVRAPDRTAILRTASLALRSNSVEINRLDHDLYRFFRLSDPSNPDAFCVLKCPPAPNSRLLRHEHDRLSTESYALQLLARRKTVPQIQYPALLDHQATSFTLVGPSNGTLLSDLDSPLSPSRRRSLDRNIGQHIRHLGTLTNPTFGSLQRPQHRSWARCFASLLLDAIRDAEDGLVSIPYGEVRDQLKRHWDCLDEVEEARLTVVELPTDGVVFDERTGEVRGLVDYGSAMWADPVFSDCFVRASEGFTEGYGSVDGEGARARRLL